MATELTCVTVTAVDDILRLHELSMEIGQWAGLPIPERIQFAANIAANSSPFPGETIQVCFSIEETENDYSIQAEIQNHSRNNKKQIRHAVSCRNLPPFTDLTIGKKADPEKNYKDMQQFTFALAHDLKNSLTKLKLALTLVEDEEMPRNIHNYFQIIQRAAERVETVMLSLNKIIQLGDSSPDVVKRISPASIFAEVQEDFLDALLEKNATVETDFSGVCHLNYIEVFLKSIFTNLVSNAIKYSSAHRPLRLSISAYRDNGKAAFLFSDNGQGIDLQKAGNKLFLPFTRFSNNPDGTGIGLYLIKNIIERNGGKIEVESTLGEGTSFRIVLVEYPLPA
jgi:signal transduction histidine kinase